MPNGLEYWFNPTRPLGLLHDAVFVEEEEAFDVREISIILKNLPESNSLVIDAGAGYGDYATSIALEAPLAIVYAFEPTLEVYRALDKNVQRNELSDRVFCCQVALADRKGVLGLASTTAGNNLILDNSRGQIPHEMVSVTTLDHFLKSEKVSRVDFIKADVEGAELLMLRGAVTSLKRFKPHLLLEIVPVCLERMNQSVGELLDFLVDLGYKNCAYFNEKKKLTLEKTERLKKSFPQAYNFFFWHLNREFDA